jgi:hypothetical protein
MPRPPSTLTKAIRSLPDLTPEQVVEALAARGLKATPYDVGRARTRSASGSSAQSSAPKVSTNAASKPNLALEELLLAVAAEMGLGRALGVLEGERERIRAILG